jgi:AcrR family transcriptional regulator
MEDDRRQQILDAALKVFAEHGYHKASIKKIADAANLKSSALIYWYFEDKAALLREIIQQATPFNGLDADQRAALMNIPPRDLFLLIGTNFLRLLDNPDALRLIRLYLSEATRNAEVSAQASVFQQEILTFLDTYLQQHIEAGTLRPHNPQTIARMFMGSMLAYLMSSEVFEGLKPGLPERQDYINEVIHTLLEGLKP